MQKLLGIVVLAAFSLSAETFKDVEYLYKAEGKDKGEQVGGSLAIDATAKKIGFQSKKAPLSISTETISNVVYERASKPRYAAGLLLAWPLLFTKSKQHFLTFQYSEGGAGKYAVFKLSKGNFREILAATEAATGKKVERSEDK